MLVLLSLGTVSVDCVHCLSSKRRAHDVWHMCHVAAFFIVSLQVLYCVFFVVLDVLLAGDLRNEYTQSA